MTRYPYHPETSRCRGAAWRTAPRTWPFALLAAVLLATSLPPAARAETAGGVTGATGYEAASAPPGAAPLLPLDPRLGVAEGFRNPAAMAEIGAGWERVVLSWAQIQPDGPTDFSMLGRTLPPDALDAERQRGVAVTGLLQFTPGWAQADSESGERSVPLNLDLPFDDPENYWGQFVYQTARYYRGRIDTWVLWNEPEFRPGDPGGGESYTWLGTDDAFARLLKVGYQAVKAANPKAVVSFPGTSYWVEQQAGREPFYARILRILAADPEAAASGGFHDAVALNLYRAPDDLPRVHALFRDIQAGYGLDKPIWLMELNAMPTDDASVDCAERQAASPFQTSMEEQAAYAIQAYALAAAAGYERIGFYQMVDGDPCSQPALWGLTRDDGTPRPVVAALRTAASLFRGSTRVTFAPRERAIRSWPAWPAEPSSLTPNWQVYQVAFDRPGQQRVTALWSGDGALLSVRLPARGTAARLVNQRGEEWAIEQANGAWLVDLPGATARFALDPPGYYFIGGAPLLLVEDGVEPGDPVATPELRKRS